MATETRGFLRRLAFASVSMTVLAAVTPAIAQTADQQDLAAVSDHDGVHLEEVVVVARKRSGPESVQDVPAAIAAFSAEAIEAAHVRDLQDLSFSAPNVSLDSVGTTAGFANFSIRGMAINGSVPSIEPTVGVFVDGVYLGVPAGVVQDTFDLEGVEVLRGPQGLLFGRNVTGGAVLIKTARPTDQFEVRAKAAIETGEEITAAVSVNGPLIKDLLSAKLAVYHKNDQGYFNNIDFGNRRYGGQELLVLRQALLFTPTPDLEFLLRLEHGDIDASGPASQNRNDFDRDSFDVSNDEEGFTDARWNQAILETGYKVDFGDGYLRNILAYRDYKQDAGTDIDATQFPFFHAYFHMAQDQISNELVYSGEFFDRWDVTAGAYYFDQDLFYIENRRIPSVPALANYSGGGRIETTQYALFTQNDIRLIDPLTLTLGLRYTRERKAAEITTLNPAAPGCDLEARTCVSDFTDSHTWESWSPKIGLTWNVSDDLLFYGHWSRGFRSGGYNLRNTTAGVAPGPYDEEKQDAYEIGMKSMLLDGRMRFNVAVFRDYLDGMQRDVRTVVGPTIAQVTRNTADVRIQGIEVDAEWAVTRDLRLSGFVGYLDDKYEKIFYDLSGDGVVTQADYDLVLPRLVDLSYGVAANYSRDLSNGLGVMSRISFSRKNEAPGTDDNVGMLSAADMLDASVGLLFNDRRWQVSLYGKNLLNDVTEGGDGAVPFNDPTRDTGDIATLATLNKGRVIGLELNVRF